jgi:hypothetical protein
MGSSMCDQKSLYWIAGRAPGTEGGERDFKQKKKRGKNGRLAYQSIIHTPHTQRDTHTHTHGCAGNVKGNRWWRTYRQDGRDYHSKHPHTVISFHERYCE